MPGSPLKRARREAAALELARGAAVKAGLVWSPPGGPVVGSRHRVGKPLTHGALRALSFVEFRERYFGLRSFWHHEQIIDAIESAKPMEITLVLVPPEHGKTTVLEDYICFRVARDPDVRITVVSEAQDHAKKILGRVKNRMTDSLFEQFQADFGPFHDVDDPSGKPWAAEFMTVDRASHDERDYTVESRGSAAAIAGTRTDLLLIDDIQSMKNLSATPALVRKFRQDFLTRPGRAAHTVIVGTRVDWADFYAELLEAGIVDHLVELPATSGEVVPCDLAEGEAACKLVDVPHERPLCPEMWSSHALAMRRRQVGEPVWWRNYQQQPQRAGDGSFTQEMWVRACDPNRCVKPLVGPPLLPTCLSLDPGMGRTGHTSVVAGMFTPTKLQLLDMEDVSGFTRLEQIPELVGSLAPLYRPSLLIIETDAMQAGIARMDAMQEMAQRFGFSIYEHRSSGEKADATLGLMAMAGGFNQGQIEIPAGDEFSVRRFAVLHDQLLGWRHDVGKNYRCDSAMALWFMWKYWVETHVVWQGGGSDFSFRGMPRGLRPTTTAEVLRR